MSQAQDQKHQLARTLNKQKIASSNIPVDCKHRNSSMLDNSMSTTQHPLTNFNRIDTYMVDFLKSYIHALARSPIAAGIDWATACIAKQKRPAKLENARKEDKNGQKAAIDEPAHGNDDSKRKVKPKLGEAGRAMDGVFKALDKLEVAVQEWTEGIEEIHRALEARATLTRALEARGIIS